MRGWLCAAGAERQYAPAALIRRHRAAAQLHRFRRQRSTRVVALAWTGTLKRMKAAEVRRSFS